MVVARRQRHRLVRPIPTESEQLMGESSQGKVVVVTGGAKNLGRAVALRIGAEERGPSRRRVALADDVAVVVDAVGARDAAGESAGQAAEILDCESGPRAVS